jgi:hypothetical protein
MILGLAGQASRRTDRGTFRPAYRKARATTMTSSSGPMTGRNSGMRSIGDNSQRRARPTASLARRGTLGSVRSRRAVVAHAGRKPARSFSVPSGSPAASATSSAHVTAIATRATTSQIHQPTTPCCPQRDGAAPAGIRSTRRTPGDVIWRGTLGRSVGRARRRAGGESTRRAGGCVRLVGRPLPATSKGTLRSSARSGRSLRDRSAPARCPDSASSDVRIATVERIRKVRVEDAGAVRLSS